MDTWLTFGLLGALLAGSGVWLIYDSLTQPRAPRLAQRLQEHVGTRYVRSRLPMPWERFLTIGALYGVVSAAAGYLISGNLVVMPGFFVTGYVMLYVAQEIRRDKQTTNYNIGLEQFIRYTRNAAQIKKGIVESMRVAVSGIGGDAHTDFDNLLNAVDNGIPLEDVAEQVAQERRNLFLDGVLQALVAANYIETGDLGKILGDIADGVISQIETFKDHMLVVERSASQVRIVVFGVWLIVGVMRAIELFAPSSGASTGTDINGFYASPTGTLLLLALSLITPYAYWLMSHTITSGIIFERIRGGTAS